MSKLKVKEYICEYCNKKWQKQNGIVTFNTFSFLPCNKTELTLCPICKPPEIEVTIRPESSINGLVKDVNRLW